MEALKLSRSYIALIKKDMRDLVRRKTILIQIILLLIGSIVGDVILVSIMEHEIVMIYMDYIKLIILLIGVKIISLVENSILIEERLTKTIKYLFLTPLKNIHLFWSKTLVGVIVSSIVCLSIYFITMLINYICIPFFKAENVFAITGFILLNLFLNLCVSAFTNLVALKTIDMRVMKQVCGWFTILVFAILYLFQNKNIMYLLPIFLTTNIILHFVALRWCKYEVLYD